MAEIEIFAVLEYIGNILLNRYPAVNNSKIERLRKEQALLNHLIEEADRSITDKYVKVHAGHMREAANLIEDVLDEYDLVARKNGINPTGLVIKKLRSRDNLSPDVKKIKELLAHIQDKGMQYYMRERVGAGTSKTVDYRLLVTPISGEEPLFGADVAVRDLTEALLEGRCQKRSAVAVLGGGGIGKSTLAKMVFASDEVVERFQIRAWIDVPQGQIVADDILSKTASKVLSQPMKNGITSKEMLVGALKGKRYLIVFDDVWSEQLWRVVKDFLPDNGVGSRVIITTRYEAVAASFITTASDCIHRLKRLSEESAWDFFHSIAFQRRVDDEENFPEEIWKPLAEIVKMCEGVPLVIRAVAGLVLRKSDQPRDLKKLIQSFSLENAILEDTSKIIARSFDDLPQHLRKCFMYFSVFPKESLIRNEKLIKLWIAEGFVQQKQTGAVEEAAEEYLKELMDRNMVEACEGFSGVDRLCRVNNMMHEIVRKKACDLSFCMVSDGESSSFKGKSRRVIISSAEGVEQVSNSVEGYQIRSFFLWNTGPLSGSILVKLFKRHYLMTMLDIENSGLEVLPDEVGYLLCLKYLSVKNTRVRNLPKTVEKLRKLEVLDLSGSLLTELPMEITKLGKLRHLLASHGGIASLNSTKGVKINLGIGALTNLQALATIDASRSGVNVVQDMMKLKQLRSLRFSGLTSELTEALCPCIDEMKLLESLHLEALKNETLKLKNVIIRPLRLESLVLKGKLQGLPYWISVSHSLRIICLSLSSLEYDPFNQFANFLELESLLLYGAYQGSMLSFKNGFRKLKLLVLREMTGLKVVKIADGVMPLLEELRIGPSPLLNEVPAGIAKLSCLKELSFYDMPNAFVRRVQPDNGSEFSKVKHVPSVSFCYKKATGRGHILYPLGDPDLLRRLNSNGSIVDTGGPHRRQDSQLRFSYSEDEGDVTSVMNISESEAENMTSTSSNRRWESVSQSSVSSDSRRSSSDVEAENMTSTSSNRRWESVTQSSVSGDSRRSSSYVEAKNLMSKPSIERLMSFSSDDIED